MIWCIVNMISGSISWVGVASGPHDARDKALATGVEFLDGDVAREVGRAPGSSTPQRGTVERMADELTDYWPVRIGKVMRAAVGGRRLTWRVTRPWMYKKETGEHEAFGDTLELALAELLTVVEQWAAEHPVES